MNKIWATLPRSPLPMTVTPMMDETIDSYLHRLAAANRLDGDALRFYATGSRSKYTTVPIDTLTVLSGQPERSLRHAIPQLATDDETRHLAGRPRPGDCQRTACKLCAAARGHTGPTPTCRSHREDTICRKHLRWLGDGIGCGGEQLDLRDQPVILNANLAHRRLPRRYGRAVTDRAYQFAYLVCQKWARQRERQEQFADLIAAFRPDRIALIPDDPAVHAAAYPQLVAVTELLASPCWESIAHQRWPRPRQLIRDLWETATPPVLRQDPPPPHRPGAPLLEILLGRSREGQSPRSAGPTGTTPARHHSTT